MKWFVDEDNDVSCFHFAVVSAAAAFPLDNGATPVSIVDFVVRSLLEHTVIIEATVRKEAGR